MIGILNMTPNLWSLPGRMVGPNSLRRKLCNLHMSRIKVCMLKWHNPSTNDFMKTHQYHPNSSSSTAIWPSHCIGVSSNPWVRMATRVRCWVVPILNGYSYSSHKWFIRPWLPSPFTRDGMTIQAPWWMVQNTRVADLDQRVKQPNTGYTVGTILGSWFPKM